MTRVILTIDDELRALYRGPLDDFVRARQALAKRLKETGDSRNGEVRELRKPSLSAWAVNQLFAHEPREMAALVGAGERARAVQLRAAAGGDPASMRDAIAAVRAAIPRLAVRGGELLSANGRGLGEAIVERLRINLEALALDPVHGATAARGWLDEDLPRPGFEVMAALQLAAAPPEPSVMERSRAASGRSGASAARPGRSLRTAHRADGAHTEAALRDRGHRARSEQLRLELGAAERAAAETAKAAERAEQVAARAAREAAESAQHAADARARAEEARRASRDAERAAARVREALERSERA